MEKVRTQTGRLLTFLCSEKEDSLAVPFLYIVSMEQKTKDNLIYLGVAGFIVAVLIAYIFYTDTTLGRIPRIPGPILWGMFSTPGIVALILERYWKYRRQRWLWFLSCAAALINIGAILIALALRWSPPVLLWSVATVVYVMVAFRVADSIVVRENTS